MKAPPRKRLKLADFRRLFQNSPNAHVINSMDLHAKDPNKLDLAEELVDALFFDMDGDLGFVATCDCGHLRGNYYQGVLCRKCNTLVSSEFVDDLAHRNWIVLPDHFPQVLHPIFYFVLKEWTATGRGTSVLDFILDPNAALPENVKSHIKGQGYRYFYENIDAILDFFFNVYPKTKNSKTSLAVKKLLDMYGTLMFTDRLPVLDPALHPISREGRKKTVDPVAADIMDAIYELSYSTFASKRTVVRKRYIDQRLWRIYTRYINYVSHVISKKLGDKQAHFRRHQLGTRVHWSCRAVIVPLVDVKEADEVHLPWKVAVNGLKLEIVNLLVSRYGYGPDEAFVKHATALVEYDQEVDEIMQTLIRECPYKGLPMLLGRNPTLALGSIQLLFLTKVKTVVEDETIGFCPLICRAPNA